MSESASGPIFLFKCAIIFLLVFANGFFVAAEFALVGVRRSRVLALVECGDRRATTLLRVITTLDAYISATQLGITLASLALGWIGEETLARAFTPVFERLIPHSYAVGAAHSVAIVLAFTIITFLHIVLGELAPKTLALERTERTALLVARPMELFYKLFKGPIWVLNHSGSLVLRLFGLSASAEQANSYTKEELRQLVEMSHQGGHIENEELQMLNNMIEFTETEIREVMVPRLEIQALSAKADFEETYRLFTECGFSRLPVYHTHLDKIIGILYLKDIVPYLRKPAKFSIARLIKSPIYLSEHTHLSEALRQMRRARVHMAIVMNEHGSTVGLVTLENVLEQIVGQIQDEYDEEHWEWSIESEPGTFIVKGGTTVKTLNRALKLEIPEESGYTTLAGFMMAVAGKVLVAGDHIEFKDWIFTVKQVEKRRILEVELTQRSVISHQINSQPISQSK